MLFAQSKLSCKHATCSPQIRLLNVGLLHIELKDGAQDVIEINIVTQVLDPSSFESIVCLLQGNSMYLSSQVTKDGSGALIRTMFNPLE